MSTSTVSLEVIQHRASKREQILAMFREHIGERISSYYLHGIYGSSLRTRISEVNNDPKCDITIRNETEWNSISKQEMSYYKAEMRDPQMRLL